MSKSVVMAVPATVDLDHAEPIPPDWILSGTPEARSTTLARSHDWSSHVVVWECTAGSFNWRYGTDEVVIFLAGEAFLMGKTGEERRFGAGDLAFFPAGTHCRWRVPDHVRKVAVLREPIWRPLGFLLKVCNKLMRILGLVGKSPLMLAVAMCTIRSGS